MWKRIGIGVAVLLVLLLVYGVAIEPRLLDTEPIEGTIPDLPPGWEGATVAFISDFQVGIFLDNASTTREAVDEILEQQPDLVLLGGDFVYSADPDPARQVAHVVDMFRPLVDAGLPTFAVLGNHDIEQNVGDLLIAELEEVGIPVLMNEAVPLETPSGGGDPLYLVGIAPHRPGLARPEAAVSQVPSGAPRLVLMHNPDSFPELPPNTAPFALAGHTHGGQIRVPAQPEWSFLALIQESRVTVDGFIDDYGAAGNQLYVNRGIGMSLIPLRINCPPELDLITLRSSGSA